MCIRKRFVFISESLILLLANSLKRYEDCLRHAKRANKIAISNNYLEEQALSFELMALADQQLDNNIVATEEYNKASEIYQELGMCEEMLRTQCLAAISKGTS